MVIDIPSNYFADFLCGIGNVNCKFFGFFRGLHHKKKGNRLQCLLLIMMKIQVFYMKKILK